MKKIIGLLALAIFALSVVPAEAQKKAAKSETVTFVTNLDCENCAKKILNVIPFKKGVKDCVVDVPAKTVEITFDPRKTNSEKLVEELAKMGADITVEGNRAIINGVERLKGASVTATDLRAGAALIIAGLTAEGETKVAGVEKIERGYDDIVGKLKSLGADIKKG